MPRPLGSKNKMTTVVKDKFSPKVTIKIVGSRQVEEVRFCQCMQLKGERLYERFAHWMKSKIKFDDLPDDEQYAWIKTATGRKLAKQKPILNPMEISFKNEEVTNI